MALPTAIAVTPEAPHKGVSWIRIVAGIIIAAVALALPYLNNSDTNTIFSQVMYLAVAAMGLPRTAAPRIAVFGDDPALEMRMARGAGALAVGMTTGLQTRESFAAQPKRDRADLVLDRLDPVIAALGG